MSDPIKSVVPFLQRLPDLSGVVVTGDMNARQVGATTVYVYLENGYEFLRDVGDRVYLAYEVYSLDREEAADLSLVVRRNLLRGLRSVQEGSLYFLDSHDEEYPVYEPDDSSREHVYAGVVSLYCQEV